MADAQERLNPFGRSAYGAETLDGPLSKASSGSWDVLMRCIASALFLLAHGLLVLEHIAIGTALHGIAELFLAPWAVRHRAWDIIVIGVIFCVFDLWGTVRLTTAIG
jgi:hypothetical protein